jgi:large subunit ribosomal protein L9
MKVFLVKDVEKVGMAGEIVQVSDGFAANFLFPRKLAVEVTAANQAGFSRRTKTIEKRQEVISSKTSMLAEKIKAAKIVLTSKVHKGKDGEPDELYGALREGLVVDALANEGIAIAKNQVAFDKPIKTTGVHLVTIKLSNKLQPKLTVKVIAE